MADSLKYLRDVLKVPEFSDNDATEEYCRNFNQLFDILNSCSIAAHGEKAPLTQSNINEKTEDLSRICTFLENLKTSENELVLNGKKKTCKVGFIMTIASTIELAKYLFAEGKECFFTRRVNQDFAEHLSGLIRQRCGSNDNPTALHLKAALRRLLSIRMSDGKEMAAATGANCIIRSMNLSFLLLIRTNQ